MKPNELKPNKIDFDRPKLSHVFIRSILLDSTMLTSELTTPSAVQPFVDSNKHAFFFDELDFFFLFLTFSFIRVLLLRLLTVY